MSSAARAEIVVLDDPAGELAKRLTAAAGAGRHMVLTGGSTPRVAYEKAAALPADWSRATFWWGDERCVPPDHEQSNYAMAKRALLDRIEGTPPAVHRMRGELGPEEGAADYERELRDAFGDGLPRLDFLLLGLGPDAHCASLFPGHPALGERERAVVGVETPGMAPFVPRITLTLPVLNRARETVFLVAGQDKAAAVARAFSGPPTPDAPASLIEPEDGSLVVLLDPAAASQLDAGR
jgi:6-phosphogluconolactonase